MEYWNLKWNIGMLEEWNIGFKDFNYSPIISVFHYSNFSPLFHRSVIPELSSVRTFFLADMFVDLLRKVIKEARHGHRCPGAKAQ
jgi:hypothetical protein